MKKAYKNEKVTIVYVCPFEIWEQIQMIRIKLRLKSSTQVLDIVLKELLETFLKNEKK